MHENMRRTEVNVCPSHLGDRDYMKSSHKELIKVFLTEMECQNVDFLGEINPVTKHEYADCNITTYVKFLIISQRGHMSRPDQTL